MNSFDKTRFAAIADIHGNADALTAVLDDIRSQDIASIVNLGDHFSGPLAARETAEILLGHAMTSIRGNHDRWLVEKQFEEMGPSDQSARLQLADEHIEWLRGLPATLALDDEIFLCHGTPSSDTAYWLETVSATGIVTFRDRDGISKEAESLSSSLVLCGHTHLPRRVDLHEGRTVVNPGSVGCPGYNDDFPAYHVMQTGTPTACYAIIEKRGEGWLTTFRQVPYDTARMVEMARDAGRLEWASALASGWVK
jgi:predicted phosphodiesterase